MAVKATGEGRDFITELINLLASIVHWLAGSAQFVDTQTGVN